jgi:hypothetical protein
VSIGSGSGATYGSGSVTTGSGSGSSSVTVFFGLHPVNKIKVASITDNKHLVFFIF